LDRLFKLSVVAIGLIAQLLLASAASPDDFMGIPGLWLVTYQTRQASRVTAATAYRCVYDDADPWTSFAQLEIPRGISCKRTSSGRTSTSLAWRLDCGAPTLVTTGKIVFDNAQHYSGDVEITGSFLEYPVRDSIHVDGRRIAACTSPSD